MTRKYTKIPKPPKISGPVPNPMWANISPLATTPETEPKDKPPIHLYWVRNFEKLKEFLTEGPFYFDVIDTSKCYSIRLSPVKYGHPDYHDRSIELFLVNKSSYSDTRSICDFVEPATCAAILTAVGFEIYYPHKNIDVIARKARQAEETEQDDDAYFSFSGFLFDTVFNKKQNALCALFSADYSEMVKLPTVSNSPKINRTPGTTDNKYLSLEDLEAKPGPEDKCYVAPESEDEDEDDEENEPKPKPKRRLKKQRKDLDSDF